jgi:hypothetical protein
MNVEVEHKTIDNFRPPPLFTTVSSRPKPSLLLHLWKFLATTRLPFNGHLRGFVVRDLIAFFEVFAVFRSHHFDIKALDIVCTGPLDERQELSKHNGSQTAGLGYCTSSTSPLVVSK